MIVIGAKGFAKEVLHILCQNAVGTDGIAFYDDLSIDGPDFVFGQFPILKNEQQVKSFSVHHFEDSFKNSVTSKTICTIFFVFDHLSLYFLLR